MRPLLLSLLSCPKWQHLPLWHAEHHERAWQHSDAVARDS